MIDFHTCGRLARDAERREAARRLAFELIERGLLGALDGRNMTGASNDGLSVTYESGAAARGAEARRLVRDFLGGEVDARGVPLLYAGSE
jgi:hypothetical protein